MSGIDKGFSRSYPTNSKSLSFPNALVGNLLLTMIGMVLSLLLSNNLSLAIANGSGLLVRGKVVDIDAKQLPLDGDAILKVRTQENRIVIVRLPAWQQLCGGISDVIETFLKVKMGDEVEVLGEKSGRNELSVCGSDYYLKIIENHK